MKKGLISLLLATVAVLGSFLSCGLFEPLKVKYEDMGIPSKDNYTEGSRGLYISDMIAFDGKIYIGDGDYGLNTGPVNVMAYDTEKREWINTGVLPDEAIKSFTLIDGVLYAPGTDPKDDWTLGNYYSLSGGEWQVHRTLPGGIHNFDLESFNGSLFASIGAEAGQFPILRSNDGGLTFQSVRMLKNGAQLDTSGADTNRTFDLISLNGELYVTYLYYAEADAESGKAAVANYELYRFDEAENAFVYHSKLAGNLALRTEYGSEFTNEHLTFKGNAYFATGYLTFSSDMKSFDTVHFYEEDAVVWDILESDGALYVLTALQVGEEYEIAVWKNEGEQPDGFKRIMYFDYEIPAVSFAFDGEYFWFGMSENGKSHSENGRVLKAKPR